MAITSDATNDACFVRPTTNGQPDRAAIKVPGSFSEITAKA